MLRYYRVVEHKRMNTREPITYDDALNTLLGSYKNNDMTRDMLTLPNRIKCRFTEIGVEKVEDNGRVISSMPGLYNLLPMDAEYDEDGNRI